MRMASGEGSVTLRGLGLLTAAFLLRLGVAGGEVGLTLESTVLESTGVTFFARAAIAFT